MRLKHILVLIFFMVIGVSLVAQKMPSLSILSLNPINLDKSVAQTITGLLEVSLIKTHSFKITDQKAQQRILKGLEASLLGCADDNCASKLGQLLAVEQILMGNLALMSGQYTLIIKIIDVSTGQTRNTEKLDADSLISLIGKIDILAYKLAGDDILTRNSTHSINTEREQKRESLLKEKKQLEKLAGIKKIALPVAIGVSVAGLATSGVFWYLSEDAYNRYSNAVSTSLAEQERRNVEFYDTIKWTSAGSTLAFVGVTLFLSLPDTSTTTIDKELMALDLELGENN